jgi:hypothetical protein
MSGLSCDRHPQRKTPSRPKGPGRRDHVGSGEAFPQLDRSPGAVPKMTNNIQSGSRRDDPIERTAIYIIGALSIALDLTVLSRLF